MSKYARIWDEQHAAGPWVTKCEPCIVADGFYEVEDWIDGNAESVTCECCGSRSDASPEPAERCASAWLAIPVPRGNPDSFIDGFWSVQGEPERAMYDDDIAMFSMAFDDAVNADDQRRAS